MAVGIFQDFFASQFLKKLSIVDLRSINELISTRFKTYLTFSSAFRAYVNLVWLLPEEFE